MAIHGSQGTRVYIGPVAPAGAVTSVAYAALAWKEIVSVETFSGLQKSSNNVDFTPLNGDDETRKGSRKVIEATVTCARDPLDEGQEAADAAEASKFAYAIKVVFPDAADEEATDSVAYWKAFVFDAGPSSVGGGNDMTKVSYRLRGKSGDLVIVPTVAGS